ncbi:hypothetical protein BT63DRAFT_422253 [Microthyrium microscopicum]|uniref:Uncharacterized protein n=1 Tax=Microthyrium microscopicum TaxID=703497 RepID=A0A6A6UJ48_9PEZI|nr:hypothetical protein BT63DRAFT_422253 [Microthyrium microscopicum]
MVCNNKTWLTALLYLAGLSITSATPMVAGNTPDDIQLPPSVPPKIKLTDKPADPSGKLVKVRYGPFDLPPNAMFSALPPQFGGAVIHKPCDECFLGAFQGGMEYEDGSEANVNNGAYLHHFVVVNNNKPDWLCGLSVSGMGRPQFIYNSGNERPPVRLNTKHKFGMRVDKGDSFSALTEIMNMSNQTQRVYVTTIYEVVPLETPGYREATHLRADVWHCGGSDVPAKMGAYHWTSPNITSPYSGVILHNDGHGHDGATEVKLHINDKVYCNSIQYYGLRPTAVQPKELSAQHGESHHSMQYISDAVACENEGRLEKGDVFKTEAFYNGTKYPQMMSRGHLEPQMGISFLYIGRDENTLNDKLPFSLTPIGGLPVEMNYTSPYPRTNVSAMLAGLGIPMTANLSQIIPGIPPWFNLSDPRVIAPITPFNRTMPLPVQHQTAQTPAFFSDIIDKMLVAVVPGLPKEFKVSNIYVPGGINLSQMELLMEEMLKRSGIQNAFTAFGDASHRLLLRSMF